MKHTFFDYNFSAEDISSWPPTLVVKRQCLGSEQFVSIPRRNKVWLLGLTYAWMESSRADWNSANGQVATDDVPKEVKVPSFEVPDMGGRPCLIGTKDAVWSKDVGSVHPRLVEA